MSETVHWRTALFIAIQLSLFEAELDWGVSSHKLIESDIQKELVQVSALGLVYFRFWVGGGD